MLSNKIAISPAMEAAIQRHCECCSEFEAARDRLAQLNERIATLRESTNAFKAESSKAREVARDLMQDSAFDMRKVRDSKATEAAAISAAEDLQEVIDDLDIERMEAQLRAEDALEKETYAKRAVAVLHAKELFAKAMESISASDSLLFRSIALHTRMSREDDKQALFEVMQIIQSQFTSWLDSNPLILDNDPVLAMIVSPETNGITSDTNTIRLVKRRKEVEKARFLREAKANDMSEQDALQAWQTCSVKLHQQPR